MTIHADAKTIGKQLIGENQTSFINNITLKNIKTSDGLLKSIKDLNIQQNEFVTELKLE